MYKSEDDVPCTLESCQYCPTTWLTQYIRMYMSITALYSVHSRVTQYVRLMYM